MIHTLRQSPKFLRLVRKLRPLANGSIVDADSVATCVLEKLWHAAITGAIRGDIGRYDNDVIAEMCGWLGDSNQLIEILVETGFLDECKDHRLVVHDWDEHAPKHVKGNVTRCGGFIRAVPLGTVPKGDSHEDDPLTTVVPNLTNSNPTQPNPTKPKDAASQPPYPIAFEEFWKAYPANSKGRKRGKRAAYGFWSRVPAGERDDLMSAVANYANEETEYVRDPERFLKADWWRDWVAEPDSKTTSRVATDDDLASWNPNGGDK